MDGFLGILVVLLGLLLIGWLCGPVGQGGGPAPHKVSEVREGEARVEAQGRPPEPAP
jgi:hypothetical protein